jgi:hypothetical protein
MAKKAGKRTARPTKKAAPRRRTLDLKEVQAALERTMASRQRRGATDSTSLQEAIDGISRFCKERGCGSSMIISL